MGPKEVGVRSQMFRVQSSNCRGAKLMRNGKAVDGTRTCQTVSRVTWPKPHDPDRKAFVLGRQEKCSRGTFTVGTVHDREQVYMGLCHGFAFAEYELLIPALPGQDTPHQLQQSIQIHQKERMRY